ncbi:MAG: holin family protein [Candidatus Sabulitectum sp.]|nr:holin family protein [Candidatus Sabulitectum sp.]
MAFDPLTAIFGVGEKLIDKLIPDPAAKAKAQFEMRQLAQNGELKELETRMSAILAEAQSSDPWTSRARPSFLYVVYLMILVSIPMGFLTAFSPETALAVTTGMQSWLAAIPESMWTLFGAGYLGYTGAREFGKHSKNKHGSNDG